ncbi:YndM family protein [Halobacillus andaensis]|uniref:YndM family protein n=1 Tax=Halobacillus andaensis TaxID=1176239 RepID=UPI003D71AACF
MKHAKYMAAKFIGCLALLFLILGVGYEMSFGNVFLITLVLGVLSYVIGDMMILPRTSNTVATISDFVLAFVVIYFMSDALTVAGDIFTASLLSAIGVAVFELIFHKYVASSGLFEPKEREANDLNYAAETSDELFPYEEKDKD